MNKRFIIIVLLSAVVLFSCEKETDQPDHSTDDGYLTEVVYSQAVNPEYIRALLSAAGYPQFRDYFRYRSAIYKIKYRTTFKDSSVIASGLVCLPLGMPQPWPVLNIYHGLIFADHEAPSSFSLPNHFIGYEFIASMGFAVFIPDLIGFGTTKDIPFGIYNKEIIAKASVDMIRAGQEMLDDRQISYSNLYMAGYSLGGYDAAATLEYIDHHNIEPGIPIAGAVIGAGGYNLHKIMKTNIMKEEYPSPAQLIQLFYSYNLLNEWNRPLTYYFQDSIAAKIPHLLSGRYSSDEINRRIPASYDSLFTPAYLQQLRNDQDTLIVETLRKNSVHTWLPVLPTRLYHSRDDEKIPFADSQEFFHYITHNSNIDVDLVDISGANHFDSAPVYIEQALTWLQSLIEMEAN